MMWVLKKAIEFEGYSVDKQVINSIAHCCVDIAEPYLKIETITNMVFSNNKVEDVYQDAIGRSILNRNINMVRKYIPNSPTI